MRTKMLYSVLAVSTVLTMLTMGAPVQENVKAAGHVSLPFTNAAVQSTVLPAGFKDIRGHWAEAAIQQAHSLKLISGYQDGTFRPNAKVTRAEFAAILSRTTRLKADERKQPFANMKGHWAEPALTQLLYQGLIQPEDYSKGFNPNTELTRYEMMKWMANGLMRSSDSFKQAYEDTKDTLLPTTEGVQGKISAEKVPYIAVVRGTDVVGGFEDGSIRPDATTTRAEVASILLRYMNTEGKDASTYQALNELREVGTTGTNLMTISNYKYRTGSAKISDIAKSTITLKNKSGILQLHRYIVVDATTSKPKGVYAQLFMPKMYAPGAYKTFADISFTSNLDRADLITFNSGVNSGLIAFNRVNIQAAEANGIPTIPTSSKQFIRKGQKNRFWISTALSKVNWLYSLKSDTEGILEIEN
ncbi:S-layer homology domain-containing protein [Paenibacillus sp. JX-17]|uniref:S-layer homology domain-containing protein n=1 Tax=Paenibacillus lacisoli TaxID=3064525 RepID=A0ABT9CBZ9_9BACL|nr:S-layer homology domain-containing protein [Paenibacillus sp. JX-17]MDO7905502.1 S-layer homology domain-containing protein [Paenibacillus sp. JX-17]